MVIWPRPGDLRYRCTIEAPPLTRPNDRGEEPAAWQLICETWCNREPMGGTVEAVSNELQAAQDYTVWIRWRPGIAIGQRVTVSGIEPLYIVSINPLGPNVWLQLGCKGKAD